MKSVISLIQIMVGILLILVVVIQQKGAGLGTTFGSDFAFYRTKRGAEKLLFYLTIVLACVLIVLSLLGLIVA